jgi:hypothetical protein
MGGNAKKHATVLIGATTFEPEESISRLGGTWRLPATVTASRSKPWEHGN